MLCRKMWLRISKEITIAKSWCQKEQMIIFLQRCHFRVGSYTYVNGLMKFTTGYLKYHEEDFQQATLLDYFVDQPERLRQADYYWEGHGNYSLAGKVASLTNNECQTSSAVWFGPCF